LPPGAPKGLAPPRPLEALRAGPSVVMVTTAGSMARETWLKACCIETASLVAGVETTGVLVEALGSTA